MDQIRVKALELAIQYFSGLPEDAVIGDLKRENAATGEKITIIDRVLKASDRFVEYISQTTRI